MATNRDPDFIPDADPDFVPDAPDAPREPAPNPDRIDAGAPTDYPLVNNVLSGAEALAVGAADLIPGALSTARGMYEANEDAKNALSEGRMPHPGEAFVRGQQATQEQRADTQTQHPLLSAVPAIASLAVPGAGLSKVSRIAELGTSPVARFGANVAAHAIPAAVGSLMEGDDLKDVATNAITGGTVGQLAGGKKFLTRAAGFVPSAVNIGKTEASGAPEGQKNIARAQTLAHLIGAIRGTGRYARDEDVDIQNRNFKDAREQTAAAAAESSRSAAIDEASRLHRLETAQADLDSLPMRASQHANRLTDTQRSSLEDRWRAIERDPNAVGPEARKVMEAAQKNLNDSLDRMTKDKLGDMRPRQQMIDDFLAIEVPKAEAALRLAQRRDAAQAAPVGAPDYARADAAIAAGPENIATGVRRGIGGRDMERKSGVPDIGGEYFIETSPFKASITHPRRALPSMGRAAMNFLPFAQRKTGNEALNEPKQTNRVEDFMATRKVTRPDGTTDTVYAYPAEAAAILKAYGAEIAPGRGAKVSADVQDAALRGMVRSGITDVSDDEKKRASMREAVRRLRSGR